MRFASLLLLVTTLGGCGLVLDTDPPDPKPDRTTPPTTCTDDAACDDGNVCNGIEGCVSGTCVVTGALDCDDHLGCTKDACDATSSACVHTPDPSRCADGAICDPSASPGTSPTGCIVPKACSNDDACDDGNACNGTESCDAGHCLPGHPIACPTSGCLVGVCDAGACTKVAKDAVCDDGIACTTGTCTALGKCDQSLDPAVCADAYDCTKDSCVGTRAGNDTTGCIHYPDDSACRGAATPVCVDRVCAPLGASPGDASGCALRVIADACAEGSRCNFVKNACETLPLDCAACDDGNPCNGTEACATTLDAGVVPIDGGLGPIPAPTGCVTLTDGCESTVVPACRESFCDLASGTPKCGTRPSPEAACWPTSVAVASP